MVTAQILQKIRLNPARGSGFFAAIALLTILSGCASESANQNIRLGCAAPLTGDQAQIGLDMCRGVSLAVEEVNASLPANARKFEVLLMDDQHNPAQAVNVAKKLLSDPKVLGVVGHFNSSCTQPASAVYHAGRLVHITPASTNPQLSRQGFDTFFRVASTDDVQGPAGARWAVNKLQCRRIFVIDDKTTYGKGLADEFHNQVQILGAQVIGHEGITQGDKDFTPLVTKIKQLAPDLIYFGGIYPECALFVRQMHSLGLNCLVMGGDGIVAPTFIELAGEQSSGVYGTMVGGDIRTVPEAARFIATYEARHGKLGQWSAYGYDAANILMTVALKSPTPSRAQVLGDIRSFDSFKGITGQIRFDAKGDNQNQFIGMYQSNGTDFVYLGKAD